MKKLIMITMLFLMLMTLTSFSKYDGKMVNNTEKELYDSLIKEGYTILPEIVVTYDTIKCRCEVTIKHRHQMGRRSEFGQKGRMNSMMGRGQMNRGQMKMQGDTAKFGRGQMMGQRGMNMRMMNPRMEQMMKEHRQIIFKGDSTKSERPMMMNRR